MMVDSKITDQIRKFFASDADYPLIVLPPGVELDFVRREKV